jgi:four helix bundle protein
MHPERMRMYQAAQQLMAEVDLLLPRAKKLKPNSAKHLENSTESAFYNTGEGIGSYKPKMKIAAYSVARKEANEVRTVLRRLVIGRVFTDEEIQRAYNLASALIAMLTAAIIAMEKRAESEGERIKRGKKESSEEARRKRKK